MITPPTSLTVPFTGHEIVSQTMGTHPWPRCCRRLAQMRTPLLEQSKGKQKTERSSLQLPILEQRHQNTMQWADTSLEKQVARSWATEHCQSFPGHLKIPFVMICWKTPWEGGFALINDSRSQNHLISGVDLAYTSLSVYSSHSLDDAAPFCKRMQPTPPLILLHKIINPTEAGQYFSTKRMRCRWHPSCARQTAHPRNHALLPLPSVC